MKKISLRFWIAAMAALVAGAIFGGCSDENVEVIGTCPLVIETVPEDGAINVPLSQVITVTFNVDMDIESMEAEVFSMDGAGTIARYLADIPGDFSYDGLTRTISFVPHVDLLQDFTYIGRVAVSAKDVHGNHLQQDYVWTFYTGAQQSPFITLTYPASEVTISDLSSVVEVTFSEPMDEMTINNGSFTLTEGGVLVGGVLTGGSLVDGTVAYSGAGNVFTFTPDNSLLNSATYTVRIAGTVTSIGGIPILSDSLWNFYTMPPLGPGAIDLGTAGDFAILTKSGISTVGTTLITGHIGVTPIDQTAITGFSQVMDPSGEFSTSIYVVGNIYAADYAPPTPTYVGTAMSDQETAFTTAMGLTTNVIVDLGAGDISALTLAPGLYKWETGLLIDNRGVTLSGAANDTWVFQIASDLTIQNDAVIILSGGAQAKNVFWVTSTQALLGSNVQFQGNILAQTLISVTNGTTILGRLLSQTAVTLNASTVTKPN
jgi:hypothetical protein